MCFALSEIGELLLIRVTAQLKLPSLTEPEILSCAQD